MKKILIILLSLFIITNAYADKCYNKDASSAILESDKKLGRFFEDQPDVNDDYQIHIIYSLLKDSKDKEGDINGALEKWIAASDEFILKTTKKANKNSKFQDGVAQNIKWDIRKDGKLDVSFIRINKTKKELKKSRWGSCGNVFGRTIINSGFNNPKKIYLNFGVYSYKDWPYSGGFPIFSIFNKHKKNTHLEKMILDISFCMRPYMQWVEFLLVHQNISKDIIQKKLAI